MSCIVKDAEVKDHFFKALESLKGKLYEYGKANLWIQKSPRGRVVPAEQGDLVGSVILGSSVTG